MPQAKTSSGIKVWGQVRVENAKDGLIYQSPPEEVEVQGPYHHRYERRRIVYCQITRGVRIPEHYRTGELPPHGFIFELRALEAKIALRRLKLWLKEHHLAMFSM